MTDTQVILTAMINDLYASEQWKAANVKRAWLLSEIGAGALDADLEVLAKRYGCELSDVRGLMQLCTSAAIADPRRGVLHTALQPIFEQVAAVAQLRFALTNVEFCVFDDKEGTAISAQGDGARLVAINGALCSKIHVFASHYLNWKLHGASDTLPASTHELAESLVSALASHNMWGGEFESGQSPDASEGLWSLMNRAYRFVIAHEFGHMIRKEPSPSDLPVDKLSVEVKADAMAMMLLSPLDNGSAAKTETLEGVAFVLTMLRYALVAKRLAKGEDAIAIAHQMEIRIRAIIACGCLLDYSADDYASAINSCGKFFDVLVRAGFTTAE